LSRFRDSIILLGADTLTDYSNGLVFGQSHFTNKLRNKTWSAVRTLVLRSHYLVEKFLTSTYTKKAKELVLKNPQALVIYSLFASASLDLTNMPAIIITHNDEIAIYKDHQRNTKNPLIKLTAAFSEKWLLHFLRNSKNYFYIHIAEADREAYSNYLPKHNSIIVPAGVESRVFSDTFYPSDGKVHLLFCGSLSIKINLEALLNFKNTFWELLKNHFGEDIDLWVAGSLPILPVIKLCKSQGWALYPDISDDELRSLYEKATFGILPYKYSTGSKIKLLNSLVAGLPVLATTTVKTGTEQDFLPNLFSDNPQKWLDHLKKYQSDLYNTSDRVACQQYAMQYSWEKIAEKMDNDLRQYGL